uniref:protein xylosyltransferase n=1 Tax=Anopheles quadriannulatus TaxID=34691 RepID=A0A1Y9J007_ANOQN
MASKKVVHSTVNRVSYAKFIFRVILNLSLIILLFKTVVYYSGLVNTKHANTLRNKSLTFSNGTEYQLACELSEKKALDAIGRVNSDECKIKLADAACKNVLGKLTPRAIVSQCPRGSYVPYRMVGCFPRRNLTHDTLSRIFAHSTPKNCVDFCLQREFRYAIVQNGKTCSCGDDAPNQEERINDGMCNAPCSGNSDQFCGGKMTSSVYETGLAKQPQQPLKLYPSPKDKPVRIAFLLMFHKRNLRQIRRLLRAIYDRNHYYYIHIDPKQHYLFRELLKLEKDFPNIHVSRQRHTITWGCFTQLQALLSAMKHLLSLPSWNPDFILNMSESDFPIKTISKLTQFLTANRGRNFVLMQRMVTVDEFISKAGYDKQFVECENRMWLIGDRALPSGIVTNGSNDWFCLSSDFVRYFLDTSHDLVAKMMAIMEHTVHSTESFFGQMLQNSPFCETHYDSTLRLISWVRGKGCPKGRSVEWTGCSPLTTRRSSFPNIQRHLTESIYAVRKINPIYDQMIVLMIEEYAYGKYPSGVPNLNAYWQSVYHHEDAKHEARMSSVLNVAHLLLYINAQENQFERYEVLKVLEITHYFNRNTFEGFLIRHAALLNDHRLELEVFVKPKDTFQPYRAVVKQLANFKLQISNTIDWVDNEVIDFDRVLTVDKQPVLMFQFPKYKTPAQTISHNISVEWINPRQRSVTVDRYTIEQEPDVIDNQPLESTALKTPLVPGVWKAKVSVNATYVGMIDFLVVNNKPILLKQVSTTTTDACVRPRDILSAASTTCQLSKADFVLRKQFRFRANVAQMYQLESTCIVDSGEIAPEQFTHKPLERCNSTLWSSFAPDPKSDVHYRWKQSG